MNPTFTHWAAAALLAMAAEACAIIPLFPGRDSRILDDGAKSEEGAGGFTAGWANNTGDHKVSQGDDARFGNAGGEINLRRGLGNGTEHAFRVGGSFVGLYGGYEFAKSLTGNPKGGIVGVGGATAGLHVLDDGPLPFVQPYIGVVMGPTESNLRPELGLRVAFQTGISSRHKELSRWSDPDNGFYGYTMAMVSATPAIRLKSNNGQWQSLGLIIAAGKGHCQECFSSLGPQVFWLLGPMWSVTLDR